MEPAIPIMDKTMSLMQKLVFESTARSRVAGESVTISETVTFGITGKVGYRNKPFLKKAFYNELL